MWKHDHLNTLTYHNKYIIPMLFKMFHSFAHNAVPQSLAIALELALSLRRWSVNVNWHAACAFVRMKMCIPQKKAILLCFY